MEFISSDYKFQYSEFSFLEYSDFKNESGVKKLPFEIAQQNSLSWEQLFSICHYYRNQFKIDKDDFVILLTLRRNDLNWFSIFDLKNNAFVHAGDWDKYTYYNSKYPTAYEVVANVLRTLMRLPLEISNNYFHIKAIGCVNDLCQNKEQIILKLRTADICPACIKKIQEENIDQKIINQVLESFEGIRNELLFKQKFKTQISPVPIAINERKQILLPQLNNLEIRLNPLFKTLYIFYLKHTEGVRLNELNDFKTELLSLYKKLSSEDNNQTIELRITDLVNPIGGSFSQKKSKLNKIITDLLGEPLAKFYRIEGEPGEPFRIKIPNNLIDIRY